jgi:hypothetical protein
MNELREKLRGLGLTDEQIDGAVQHVAEYVKGKLPSEYSGVVDTILAGETPDLSSLASSVFKNLF